MGCGDAAWTQVRRPYAESRGDTGESLTQAVAALEHLRLALVKRQSGVGSASDLTLVLERAKEIGDHVERRLAAAAEVQALLE